jgi:hypothetical protein
VLALIGSLAWCLIPFGGLLGGFLVEGVGLEVALVLVAVAYFLATTLPALRPEWREMDARRQSVSDASGASAPEASDTSRDAAAEASDTSRDRVGAGRATNVT